MLGVTIEARLSFKHLLNADLKSSRVARALAGFMPNIQGPKQPRRILLSSVVRFVILHAAPTWTYALSNYATYGAICRHACHTVAWPVSTKCVVNRGIPSIDLQADESGEVQERPNLRIGRKTGRVEPSNSRRTREEWQRRLD